MRFQIDEKLSIQKNKIIFALLLTVLIAVTSLLYVERQNYQSNLNDVEAEMVSARDDALEAQNTIEKQNKTIENLNERVEILEEEKQHLSKEASESIVTGRYQGLTDEDTARIKLANYGEETTNITGTCQGREKDADTYHSFDFSLDRMESNSERVMKVKPEINNSVQELVDITCNINDCAGNCRPAHKKLDG